MALPHVNDRTKSAIAAILLQGVLGYALVVGLGVNFPQVVDNELKLFAVGPPPPPPPPEKVAPKHATSHKREGAASPPNLKAKATEVVAPKPVLPPPVPPPVVAALKAGLGAASSAGAAPIVGPGTGAGGVGDGTGSGGSGDGDGDGDGEPPVQIKGRIKDSDYPKGALDAGIGGKVGVRYVVGEDGRITNCSIAQSSGNAELDATTCRLIQERFRYRPWRDPQGRPGPSTINETHEWVPHGNHGDATE